MPKIKDTPASYVAPADQAWYNDVSRILKYKTSTVVITNNVATTYTMPDDVGFVRFTGTNSAAIAFTLPAASVDIDGLELKFSSLAAVATLTWASVGATFDGAPTAFVANTPFALTYNHATTSWIRSE